MLLLLHLMDKEIQGSKLLGNWPFVMFIFISAQKDIQIHLLMAIHYLKE